MDAAVALVPVKGHKDENFPVASLLLKPEHRAPIMAFYRFARAADDIADRPGATENEKIEGLRAMRAGLRGGSGSEVALALHAVLRDFGIDPVHAEELLDAFEQDVTVQRYPDWDALIDYCRQSAMPVGRFVLDVHGEDRALWSASDALCAALQIINHLQDCGKDYRAIDRVYIPADSLARHGAAIEDLGMSRSTPALRAAIGSLAKRTDALLDESASFAAGIRDRRLAAEVAIIQRLARSLVARLERRDPLSERVHHGRIEAALIAARAAVPVLLGVAAMNPRSTPAQLQSKVSGSSFYAGMRVLPKAEREAMYAIYAFCRAVDDIADDQQGDQQQRAAALKAWRRDIDSLYEGGEPGQAMLVAEAVRRFALARADFHAVIDGMAMDVAQDIRWPPADTLDLYCDRVASAVGRLSVEVFGMADAPGEALAHHLGRALQLTNILRDIDEDAAIGRVYLPGEAITAAGITLTTPAEVVADPRIDGVARGVAAQAEMHFHEANAILAGRPRGHLLAPRLMAAAYAKVLGRMQATGWALPRHRVRVSKAALLWTVLRLSLTR